MPGLLVAFLVIAVLWAACSGTLAWSLREHPSRRADTNPDRATAGRRAA